VALDEAHGRSRWATLGAILLTTSASVTFVPWRATDKYFHYRGMQPDLRVVASGSRFRHSLVLVRGEQHPDYHGAAVLNSFDPESFRPVFAWDRDSATRAEVVRAFSDRPVWLVDGPSITGDGYRITVDAKATWNPPGPRSDRPVEAGQGER
jgi:hypothetical protein